MVVLTLLICLLNVCLGFVLAMRLGYGPPSLLDAWEAMSVDPAAVQPYRIAPQPVEGPIEEPAEEPVEEPAEDPLETSILQFKTTLVRDLDNLTEIDSELREDRATYDADLIQQHVGRLKRICETYLADQEEAADRFHERTEELDEMKGIVGDVETSLLEQTAQIETTLSNMDHVDFASDPAGAQHRLLNEVDNLRMAGHKLKDCLDVGFLAVVRHKGRLAKIEHRLQGDPLTRLPNRAWLEKNMEEWWQEGRHRVGQISMALFDPREFGVINRTYSPLVGDQILHHVGQLLPASIDRRSLVVRFGGQSFLVVMFDMDPQKVAQNAELIRRSLESVGFTIDDHEIRLTFDCCLAEVLPEDTPARVLKQLERSISEEKDKQASRQPVDDVPAEQINLSPPGNGQTESAREAIAG